MPELTLEIGGRVFEVACEPGQEASLERAAQLLAAEAARVSDGVGKATEKRMLLLAGLMLADSMTGVEQRLAATEERLRAAEERARIAEAKSAMLAANALKLETEASHKASPAEVAQLREEHEAALELLAKVLDEINDLAESAAAAGPDRPPGGGVRRCWPGSCRRRPCRRRCPSRRRARRARPRGSSR